MTVNPIILAVVATAAALILLNYLKGFLEKERARRQAAAQAQANLALALDGFAKNGVGIAEAMKGIQDLPKFMDGLVKVCQALVLEVSKQRKATERFTGLILQGQDHKEALQVPTESDKDKAFREMEYIAGGMEPAAAAAAVEDEDLKKNQYGGVTDLS